MRGNTLVQFLEGLRAATPSGYSAGRWNRAGSVPRQRPTQHGPFRVSDALGGSDSRRALLGGGVRSVQRAWLAQNVRASTNRLDTCAGENSRSESSRMCRGNAAPCPQCPGRCSSRLAHEVRNELVRRISGLCTPDLSLPCGLNSERKGGV